MARFESLRIQAPGATLDARHYPGDGEPIVLLHGGPGMGNYFERFPEILSGWAMLDSASRCVSSCRTMSCGESCRPLKAVPEDWLDATPLTIPILIVQGRQDVIRETNAILAARYPASTNVWIEDASHFPWVEQPEIFSTALLAFYRRVTSAAPNITGSA